MIEDRGVLYIAFGENFIKEALISAESVKIHNPDLSITIFSDKKISSEFINNSIVIEPKHIRAKVDFIDQTPYEKTLFLDSDTVIVSSIIEEFSLLDKFDLAICHDLARKRDYISSVISEYQDIPYSFSEVNPGVIFFKKNENTLDFFNRWKKLFYQHHEKWPFEQPTFRIALWQTNLKLYILPSEFNLRSKDNLKKVKKNKSILGKTHLEPRIYHLHADPSILKGKNKVNSLRQALKICIKKALDVR